MHIWTYFTVIFALHVSSFICTKNILIFGGNGFIGSECVYVFLSRGHNVTLLNRGSTYYDFETRIKPRVTIIKCDRYIQSLFDCRNLVKNNSYFDVILDFSAHDVTVIKDAIHFFHKEFGTYIYISTDSVYDISGRMGKRAKESDASMPRPEVTRHKIGAQYGYSKLLAEELLFTESMANDLKFVILRLPDVIGPRDTTYRWWAYQTLIQFYSPGMNVHLPSSSQSLTTSYVYVEDVAEILTIIIDDLTIGTKMSLNETFNFAFPTAMSLKKVLHSMQKALNVQDVKYIYTDSALNLYPSVKHGAVDVKKIKYVFQYETIPWMQAVQETVTFFKEAFCDFPQERNKMLEKLNNIVSKEDFSNLMDKLREHISFCTSSSPMEITKSKSENNDTEQKHDEL